MFLRFAMSNFMHEGKYDQNEDGYRQETEIIEAEKC